MKETMLVGLLAVAFGIALLVLMIKDWDWFYRMRRVDFLVRIMTRKGVRILYSAIGIFLIVFGTLVAIGVIEPPKK